MFELTKDEFQNLRSQIVTSSWGGARYIPMAFTEQGVALRKELEELKQITDERFQIVFETLDQLLHVENTPKKKIGFIVKEKLSSYGKPKKIKL
jgi:hypothetical protein